MELYLPGLVPKAAQDAHFQMLLPLKWPDENYKPVCVHFAGTGDHVSNAWQEICILLFNRFWNKTMEFSFLTQQYFWRRRNFMAKPLLREAGIGAILLENPFYGVRKPKEQVYV